MGTIGHLSSAANLNRELLAAGWQLCGFKADEIRNPAELSAQSRQWTAASCPSTVASTLRQAGVWNLDGPLNETIDGSPTAFDAQDWWYRLAFRTAPTQPNEQIHLCFGGLATLAEVWLNGSVVLRSENMFQAHKVDVSQHLSRDPQAQNELVIRFRALEPQLALKRPRPRWKAPMIQHQQLRWFRTTLLGRTPGWSPSAPPIGPWREIWLERCQLFRLEDVRLQTSVTNGRGRVKLTCRIVPLAQDARVTASELRLQHKQDSFVTPLTSSGDHRYEAQIEVENPALWWPHTHGNPALYKVDLQITAATASPQKAAVDSIDLGRTGFRTISVDTCDGNFEISVNGVRVFCRGACWTPLDVISLNDDVDALQRMFAQLRAGGMNMLRVGGTMVYESHAFLDLCDASGILLWQDLMFANMDYPETEEFVASIATELQHQLPRLAARPCLTVVCGNSEAEQQAAMFGAPRDRWSPALFHVTLPEMIRSHLPDIHYWPSSAHGGAFPHQNDIGTTSYYGVGAYMRPLEDARRSEVKFATECLAFANVPEWHCIDKMPGGAALKVHHPAWKQRTPRDLGAGWDFEDVRDHYLQLLFQQDPAALRYANHDRYLELGRVATGEVAAATFAEWRRGRSSCNGALVWFLKDFYRGAGWGMFDADGNPKSIFYYLKRALQPTSVSISNEGCNGLAIHLVNDAGNSFVGKLELKLFSGRDTLLTKNECSVHIASHSSKELSALELVEYFSDLNNAYRFGPPSCDLIVATLRADTGAIVSEAFCLPLGLGMALNQDPQIRATATQDEQGDWTLHIQTQKLALAVQIDIDGCHLEDQYFHLAPASSRSISLGKMTDTTSLRGAIRAINGARPTQIEIVK